MRTRGGIPRRAARHLAALLVVCLALLAPAAAARDGRHALERYAHDTWQSFVAMTDPASGLPADSLSADGTTSVQTSTTNIGAYLWSTLAARRLGFIGRAEMLDRISRTL